MPIFLRAQKNEKPGCQHNHLSHARRCGRLRGETCDFEGPKSVTICLGDIDQGAIALIGALHALSRYESHPDHGPAGDPAVIRYREERLNYRGIQCGVARARATLAYEAGFTLYSQN